MRKLRLSKVQNTHFSSIVHPSSWTHKIKIHSYSSFIDKIFIKKIIDIILFYFPFLFIFW